MEIRENEPLAQYTTFKIGGKARYFCVVENQFDALEAYEFARDKNLKTFILGGGSNVLISDQGFDGLVVKVFSKGVQILTQDDNHVILEVGSGENWDEVVKFAVKNGWWGLENLSHIPGSTGAIAVQNVGAYGQEAAWVIESVTVFNTENLAVQNLKNEECAFGYRSSIFNTTEKGKYIIFDIVFKLYKNGTPNISYRDLQAKFGDSRPSLDEIREAVIEIRDKKYPFPVEAKNGNAGSFFKNPIMSKGKYEELESNLVGKFSEIKLEQLRAKIFIDAKSYKIPAAFLVEVCGLKDLQSGGAAVNPNQPLVIVNATGTATAQDVLALAGQIKQTVMEKTGIELQFEPELVGFN